MFFRKKRKQQAIAAENNLGMIAKHFPDYEICFCEDQKFFEILHPFGKENITVEYVPNDEWTPYVVSFSFQHWHMNDEEDIVECIRDVINGKVVAIEFFRDGKRRFGGDIEAQELEELSYESLAHYIGDFGVHKLVDVADSFKVRGWNADADFDATFNIDDCGKITVKKQM